MAGVIVIAGEHDVPDALLSEREQHRGRRGRERRVENQRERGEQVSQLFDLLRARRPGEERVHYGELHRARADRRERRFPGRRMRQSEPRRRRPAQPLELDFRNRA